MFCVLPACSSSSDGGLSQGAAQPAQLVVNETTQAAEVIIPGSTQAVETGTDDTIEVPVASGNVATPTLSNELLVAGASTVNCDAPTAEFQSTMLAVINESRLVARMCGADEYAAVGTLAWNDLLTDTAVVHAQDMVEFNFFSHTGSDGLGVSQRASAAGYSWRAIGENIAAGQLNVAEVHLGWLESPGHCENIMNAEFSEVGAACIASDSNDFGSYWAVVFGDQQ